MALYYKFKSAKQFTKFPICERYISVGELKALIFESKIGRGKDFDVVITNADTGEDYDNESTMILANTTLLLRRIPGFPRKAIVIGAPAPVESIHVEQDKEPKPADVIQDSEWDEFFASNSRNTSSTLTTVDDSISISDTVQTTVPKVETETRQEIKKIAARNVNLPPNWYICHRCNIVGHFIQHCPTNGDPNYDIKKLKVATSPIQNEVKGMSSNANNSIPSEFYCKLCKKIMENAVMTRCCFDSFCDKCIRNFTASNSKCLCGFTNVPNDYLLPNLTLRNTISRIMASNKIRTQKNEDENVSKILQGEEGPSPGQSLASHDTKILSAQSVVLSNKDKDILTPEESESSSKNKNDERSRGTEKPLEVGELPEISAQYLAANNCMAFAGYNSYWNITPGLQSGTKESMSTVAGPCTHFVPHTSYGVEQCLELSLMEQRNREFEASRAAPKRKQHESLKKHNDWHDKPSKKFKTANYDRGCSNYYGSYSDHKQHKGSSDHLK